MAEKKKRKGRRAYLDDFYRDVSGEYHYTGALRRYEGTEPYRQAVTRVGVLAGIMALAMVLVGLIPAPSMLGIGNFYVVLPYIAELVGAALSVWAAIRMIAGGAELRNYVYEATVEKLPNRLEMTAVFAAVCVAGNVLYLILKGFGGRVIASLAVILLHGAVIAAALLLKKHLSTLRWSGGREEETPELPEE